MDTNKKRVSLKEVKKTNARLKRQLAKEEKRKSELLRLYKENDDLGDRLFSLRNERNFPVKECC